MLECYDARAEDGTSMFVILWEFEVKPGSEGSFEKVYGPTGAWVQLFQRDPHYRGTKLLRDVAQPLHYYTIDYWDFEFAYRDFLNRYESAYKELDRSSERLTVHERQVLSGVPEQPVVL
jgi:heme-degrading monooxygenase HmoA